MKKLGMPRVLIIGCGDVGLRLLPLLTPRYRVLAVTSNPQRCAELRAAGAVPIVADLDRPLSLGRLGPLADRVIHLAPPPSEGPVDRRTRNVAAILPEGARVVYISTTGVYGDCDGAFFDETRTARPRTARAVRRVDAENVLRAWARRRGGRLSILRVPGIYAADRLPAERLRKGTPALAVADDVYTNHIHGDDLAQATLAAMRHGASNRLYHAVDDTDLRTGDFLDAVADALALPRPPRMPRADIGASVSPMMLSFMSESRRLDNRRLREELGVRLIWPDVQSLLATLKNNAGE
ncbi:NAD-dependent epimerase/dehydratase family protein [Herbaspirillum sp. alder98]|uniref:NAD-dependent epimerase/dehydratase family protein n=1 Tax=Herbaspirillum sp. alder98 TaxID=2913096 RepID=UPI001CD83559|nr:NAD-dependent epimerase/dehydratase family protein [Herbaspirillum sp. alder98]MCA1323166.1 sugar nucleotide-binding protein [Herbaspirillum sp. alder98]